MGRLFQLVEAHRKAQAPYPPSYARIAEQVGVSRQTLLNWRHPTKLIDLDHLVKLAEVTRVPYQRALDALLEDIGYLRPAEPAKAPKVKPLSATEREVQETVGELTHQVGRASKNKAPSTEKADRGEEEA